MTRLFYAIILTVFSVQAFALECTGTNQWVETTPAGDQMKFEQVDLKLEIDNAAYMRMSADLGETHFFIQGDKATGEYLLMITLGPDYTKGVTMATTYDEKVGMRMTRVDGYDVFKLKCI